MAMQGQKCRCFDLGAEKKQIKRTDTATGTEKLSLKGCNTQVVRNYY